jgi:hypothetical protein
MEIKLVLTCSFCPEQYEAFGVDFPDCGGKTIYEAYPKGDGCFMEEEREKFLNKAREAIKKELIN